MAMTDIIFCGNPGVGKSSIATSISGIQFQSGVSFGSGLTVKLEWNESPALPNIRFADTPGLADMELKEQAAQSITEALAQGAASGRKTKIIFVMTTEGGRLRPEDMYTIKVVMNSIELANGAVPGTNSYAIIINKCVFLDNPRFLQGGRDRIEKMLSDEKTNPIPSAYVKFLPAVPHIEGQDNAKICFDGLLEWVLALAPFIQVEHAEAIDTSSQEDAIEAMKLEHEAAIQRLEALTAEQAREVAAASEARQAMEAKLKEQFEKAQKQFDAIQRLEALTEEQAREVAAASQARQVMEANFKEQLERAKEEAAATGGGKMGAFVDATTLISKPICKAISLAQKESDDEFQRNWNQGLGMVKRFCFI